MFKDRKFIWVLEYLIGLGLLAVIMPSIVRPHPGWSSAHSWAYLLFIACAGVVLVSAAGSMRQRMQMVKRIEQLERAATSRKRAQSESEQRPAADEHYAGSMN